MGDGCRDRGGRRSDLLPFGLGEGCESPWIGPGHSLRTTMMPARPRSGALPLAALPLAAALLAASAASSRAAAADRLRAARAVTFARAGSVARAGGVTGADPAWAAHLGGGPSQVTLLNHIVNTACAEGIARDFLRKHVLDVPEECPAPGPEGRQAGQEAGADSDNALAKCLAMNYLIERSCPQCPPKLVTGGLGGASAAAAAAAEPVTDCKEADKVGPVLAQDLITDVLDKLVARQQEDRAVAMVEQLVAKTCARFSGSPTACEATYECSFDAPSKTCVAEPCAFIAGRDACESSPAECIYFGGGTQAVNPFPPMGTGVTVDAQEVRVGGAGCFASPCRVSRTSGVNATQEHCEALKPYDVNGKHVYACKYHATADTSLMFDNGGVTGGVGCYDRFLNGNAKQEQRKNLGNECMKTVTKRNWRRTKKFNAKRCTKPGACPAFCGGGMCCKAGSAENGCTGSLPGASSNAKGYVCVDQGPRTTEFTY